MDIHLYAEEDKLTAGYLHAERQRPHSFSKGFLLSKVLARYTHIKQPLDLSCFGGIIIAHGRKIKIAISNSRNVAKVVGREAIQEVSATTHAILIRKVRFRIVMTQSNYAH